jgi:ADP-heptose:LPS heptosyltransferase
MPPAEAGAPPVTDYRRPLEVASTAGWGAKRGRYNWAVSTALGSPRVRWRRRGLRLLGALLRFRPLPRRPVRRVALVRPDHLGDLVLATPAIARLRAALTDLAIDLWVGPWAAELAAAVPGVTVRTLPFPAFERAPKPHLLAPYRLLLAAARQVRQQQYDAAVILRFDHWWGALLTCLAGVPLRIGYDQPETRPFLSHALPYRPGRHETLQNSRLIDQLIRLAGGVPPSALPDRPRLQLPAAMPPLALPPRYAVFHPGAGAPVKRWRPERFGALAQLLAEQYGLAVVITGSASERSLVAETAAACPPPVIQAVGLSLAECAAILQRASVVIGPDSGMLHLASALSIPTVRLYGPVDPRAFGPWADPHSVVVASVFPCAPCNRLDWPERALPDHPCIQEIPLARVAAAVAHVLPVAAR